MDENTIYDNQSPYQDEKTVMDNANQPQGSPSPGAQRIAEGAPAASGMGSGQPRKAGIAGNKGMSVGAKIAAAAGGVALGSAVVLGLTSMAKNPDGQDQEGSDSDKPDWLTGDVKVAEVSDDMSFNEAFAAAREQVGPGGAFEWHGQVYGTYTASEWNHMSAAERAEWGDNFAFNAAGSSTGGTAHTTHTTHTVVEEHHVYEHHTPGREVIGNHGQSHNVTPAPPKPGPHVQEEGFEVLSVTHDAETGASFAHVKVNGQHCVLMDRDNDLQFDVMVVDRDGDGQLSQDEVESFIDISDGNITVQALGGFTDGTSIPGDQMAMNDADGPDYAAEAAREMAEDEDGSDLDSYQGEHADAADGNGGEMAEVFSAEPQTAEVEGVQAEVVSYGNGLAEGEVTGEDGRMLAEATHDIPEGAVTDTYGNETFDTSGADIYGTDDSGYTESSENYDTTDASGAEDVAYDVPEMSGTDDITYDTSADNFDTGLS